MAPAKWKRYKQLWSFQRALPSMLTPNRFQVLLSDESIKTPDGFRGIQISKMYVYFDAQFEEVSVTNSNGDIIGTIIGFPYDSRAKRFLKSDNIKICDNVNSEELEISSAIEFLCGSFIFIVHRSNVSRLYMDHGGSIPIVYLEEKRIAASGISLIFNDQEYENRLDKDIYANLVNRERVGGWISGTLTAHTGVRRLLPNHYLDLSTWTATRYWPTPDDLKNEHNSTTAAPIICRALTDFTAAAFDQFKTSATLTAGYDSRMLMMASRESLEKAKFFTVKVPEGRIDVDVARSMTKKFAVSHEVIEPVISTPEETEIWDRAVGHCVDESNRTSFKTLERLSDTDFILTGMFGEIGRCRLYRQDYNIIDEKEIDESFVISRLTLPQYKPLNKNIKEWLDSLSGIPNSTILDLAFWELKFGSWAMGQRPIQNSVKYALHPFTQRSILRLFLSLDPGDKQGGVLFDACLRHQWPELLEIPINSYGDYRDYLEILRKLSNPYRVRRFLRDRLAHANR